jgi:hypothetical protein
MFEWISKTLFGKEANMAEQAPPNPAAAAAPAGLTPNDLEAAIAKMVKPLVDRLEAFEKKAAAPSVAQADPAAAAAKPLTAADVAKVVSDALASRDASTAVKTAVATAATRMADLPDAYKALLPQTADAGALAKAEQDIRTQYAADFKRNAPPGTLPNVNGAPPANGSAATRPPLDTSKMSTRDLGKLAFGQEAVAAAAGAAGSLDAANAVIAGAQAAQAKLK